MAKRVNAIQTIDTSDLVKKADYNTIIEDIEKIILDHDKYITSNEFNKLTKDNFAERLKQANVASKNDIADFVKKHIFWWKPMQINKTKLNDHITNKWSIRKKLN